MSSVKKGLLVTALLWASPAAAVSVVPLNHGGTDTAGIIYFPIAATLSASCSGAATYPANLSTISGATGGGGKLRFQITNGSSLSKIVFGDETSTVTDGQVSIRVEDNADPATGIALVPPTTSGGVAGNGYNDSSAFYPNFGTMGTNTTVKTVEFAISLDTLLSSTGYCTFLATKNGSVANCQTAVGSTPTTVTLNVGLLKHTTGGTLAGTAAVVNADYTTVRIRLADCPPTSSTSSVVAPSISSANVEVVPGDGRVRLVNSVSFTDNTVPLKSVVVVAAKRSTTTDPTLSNADVPNTEYVGQYTGNYYVENLTNDAEYCFSLGYVNVAGFISTLPNPGSCGLRGTPSKVEGFLSRSTCFIASVAYGDEWDPRLEILRQFRDQVLRGFELGRAFEQWYYGWSPKAAHWLMGHPYYKEFARTALFPVVETARIALWTRRNTWIFGVLLVVGTAAMAAWALRPSGRDGIRT